MGFGVLFSGLCGRPRGLLDFVVSAFLELAPVFGVASGHPGTERTNQTHFTVGETEVSSISGLESPACNPHYACDSLGLFPYL